MMNPLDIESTPISGGWSAGSERGNPRSDAELMYKAASEGNWEAAKRLLTIDGSLACGREISEAGDRALHVAIREKQTEMVQKLIEYVGPGELYLQDGRGYTACCYAAMTGTTDDISSLLLNIKRNLCYESNRHGTTPLQLAVFYGNAIVAMYFLQRGQNEGPDPLIKKQGLFQLLLDSVSSKMYGVALKILEIDESLAGMSSHDGRTALHILADQLDISSDLGNSRQWQPNLGLLARKVGTKIRRCVYVRDEETEADPRSSLTKKLWDGIQKVKSPEHVVKDIMNDAAKAGNVELITMITTSYPQLLWPIAVIYRHEALLKLIKQASNKDFHEIPQFENGNNILHLAAKLHIFSDGCNFFLEPDLYMKSELAWFKEVEKIVPRIFVETRNEEGYKPREVFWKEHKSLLEEGAKHMKSTSESCMLVATIILTLVFAAAFAPPGGYHENTGIPLLLKNNWFGSFVIFEVLALFSSTYSILTFWSIISSNYEQEQFLSSPNHLRHALSALLFSVFCVISAFLSAFFLVFVQERKALVVSFMLPVYVWLVVGVSFQFFKLLPKTNLLEYYSQNGAGPGTYSLFNDSLWSRVYCAGINTLSAVRNFIRSSSQNITRNSYMGPKR